MMTDASFKIVLWVWYVATVALAAWWICRTPAARKTDVLVAYHFKNPDGAHGQGHCHLTITGKATINALCDAVRKLDGSLFTADTSIVILSITRFQDVALTPATPPTAGFQSDGGGDDRRKPMTSEEYFRERDRFIAYIADEVNPARIKEDLPVIPLGGAGRCYDLLMGLDSPFNPARHERSESPHP